jgi:hypothetical protein
MLFSEIIAVCSEIHIKHVNTLCGQNVEFENVKNGGTYSNHWALKSYLHRLVLRSVVFDSKWEGPWFKSQRGIASLLGAYP